MMRIQSRLLSAIPGLRHQFDGPLAPPPENLGRVHQVHGDTLVVTAAQSDAELAELKADGLITARARVIGVQTADCIPALMASSDGRAAAAVHAGWRGLNKGILIRAVESFTRIGIVPGELVVAIGPAIGACCFEVNREVIDAFEKSWGYLWRMNDEKPWFENQPESTIKARSRAPASTNNLWIDLGRIAGLQLTNAGVNEDRIENTGYCTYCGPGALSSYRRSTHEQVKAGRQWSWIRPIYPA